MRAKNGREREAIQLTPLVSSKNSAMKTVTEVRIVVMKRLQVMVCVVEVMALTGDFRETRKSLNTEIPFKGLFMTENKCLILVSPIEFSKPSLRPLARHAV